jgi:transcriptional regulator with XRE-family HTH domain
MDRSQIRSWVKAWLREQRERAGLSQERAAVRAGVGIGVVRSAEQTGSPPELENFLRLVMAYEAEEALVKRLRDWRNASGEVIALPGAAAHPARAGQGGESASRNGHRPKVPRAPVKPIILGQRDSDQKKRGS